MVRFTLRLTVVIACMGNALNVQLQFAAYLALLVVLVNGRLEKDFELSPPSILLQISWTVHSVLC
jgi:hypothetical protein